MTFRNLALASAGLLVLAFTSLAQVTAIEGDAKDENGQPLVGAKVQITRTDIKGNYSTKTDKKGHYIYTGLQIGTYDITLLVGDKEADKVKGIRTSPGDPRRADFNLKSAKMDQAAKNAEMQKAVETGQMSKELERSLTPEQKAAMEKQIKDASDRMKKNKELNDAYSAGVEALNAKQYEPAIEHLSKASELDATQLAVWSRLAEAHKEFAKTKTGPDFDAEMVKCLDAYTKAIGLKPDDAGIHNNYALALAQDKKFPEAQTELKKAAELDPTNGGKYYYNLGALLVNGGQYEPAADVFKKAIELQPTYADAYYQYAVCMSGKMQTAADGKVTAPPEMTQSLQKYLEMMKPVCDAPNATDKRCQIDYPAALEMLKMTGASLQTNYKNPSAPDTKKKKK
jgi:tetratricopeptide (TPR) repeat protein